MGFYAIGTALTNRLGFPKHIQFPFKGDPPKAFRDKRGMCTLVRCAEYPDIHAAAWLDRKPVYFLATGVSTCQSSVQRKLTSTEVTCPEFVADYNTFMGGVDTHDQLRLQRYSVQRSVRFAKYYKMLFLGLFDMALVNSYIVHREYCRSVGEKPLSHALFRTRLHEQLLELTPAKFCRHTTARCVERHSGRKSRVLWYCHRSYDSNIERDEAVWGLSFPCLQSLFNCQQQSWGRRGARHSDDRVHNSLVLQGMLNREVSCVPL